VAGDRGPAEGATPGQQVPVTVSIEEGHDIDEVVRKLRRAGVEVNEVFEPLRLLIGRARADLLAAVRGTTGVAAAEVERQYHLPPPESDLQ